jgi:hypothetical protein
MFCRCREFDLWTVRTGRKIRRGIYKPLDSSRNYVCKDHLILDIRKSSAPKGRRQRCLWSVTHDDAGWVESTPLRRAYSRFSSELNEPTTNLAPRGLSLCATCIPPPAADSTKIALPSGSRRRGSASRPSGHQQCGRLRKIDCVRQRDCLSGFGKSVLGIGLRTNPAVAPVTRDRRAAGSTAARDLSIVTTSWPKVGYDS